jgi:hypothetical protein
MSCVMVFYDMSFLGTLLPPLLYLDAERRAASLRKREQLSLETNGAG